MFTAQPFMPSREGFHPLRPRSGPRRRPKRCLHHFISHSAEKEGIGPVEILDRVTMQVFVQCDVDRIPKGSHSKEARVGFQPTPLDPLGFCNAFAAMELQQAASKRKSEAEVVPRWD
jgi:hypothetical protein